MVSGRRLTSSEQITGRERDRIGRHLRTRYEDGESIRDLVAQSGRSYGWVRMPASLGLDALTIGAEAGSARIRTELARLDDALTPWNAVPAADFRTAMKDTLSRRT